MTTLPAAAHDDFVDSTTQALNDLRSNAFTNIIAYYGMQVKRWRAEE